MTSHHLLVALASGLLLLGLPAPACAQESVQRELRMLNRGANPVVAFVRAQGPDRSKGPWSAPLNIGPGGTAVIALHPSAWYDVAFLQPDGNYLYVPDLPLNRLMDSFAEVDQPHLVSAAYGNWDSSGFKRLSGTEFIAEVFTTERTAVLAGRWK